MATEQPKKNLWGWVICLVLIGVPAFILGSMSQWGGLHMNPLLGVLIFGIGIIAGAFLLSWAAEVAQLDVSGSFAIAILALIAILPEYVIEANLAWKAGASYDLVTQEITPEIARVAANVTGANRLLIGLGWSLVIIIYWVKRRRDLDMRGFMGLEMTMLLVATIASLAIFFMSEVHIVLAIVLIALYIFYLWISSTRESEEPELMGAALLIGVLPKAQRRMMVIFLFIYAAAVIIAAAEPFVEGLIDTGSRLGIDDFLLIQWLAPLASESPEIIVAVLFALRANPVAGLTALISSEVNQLTVLVGSMPVVFSMAAGEIINFPLDGRQSIEFLLTTAVSLFALLLIAKRVISVKAGAILLFLFVAHLVTPFIGDKFFPDFPERVAFTFFYFGLAGLLVAMDWRRVRYLFNSGPV